MLISNYDPLKNAGVKHTAQPFEPSPSDADVDFFSSQLHPTTAKSVSASHETPNLLMAASAHIDTTKDRIAKSLKTLSKSVDREAMMKYPNELSNALFMSHLAVKSLGKTTQCIDKICNLQ